MGRRGRWLIYAPVALIAFFSSPVAAQDFITWTCWADTSWQMQQPVEDYQAGLYPNWSDCERWRNGTPDDPWLWSYGVSVAATTTVATSSTLLPSSTSSVPVPDTSLPAESSVATTAQSTTTVGTTTTVPQSTTTAQPIPQTEASPETTEMVTTTTEMIPTTTEPSASTTTSSIPVLPSSSSSLALESTVPMVATPPTFIFSDTAPVSDQIETPPADASDEEKEQFENAVNIFDGTHDDYVPVGSTITVEQRRTIVAASTILMTLPTPTASRRKQ